MCIRDRTSVTSLNDKISNIDLFPNPTFYESILTLTAASAEQIHISIVDVQGKLVLTPIEKTLNVGKNAIPLSTNKLMSGIYFIQLKSGSYSNKLKLEVMH